MSKTENWKFEKQISTQKDECESWVECGKSLRNVIWSKIKWKIWVVIDLDEMQVGVKLVDPMEGVITCNFCSSSLGGLSNFGKGPR